MRRQPMGIDSSMPMLNQPAIMDSESRKNSEKCARQSVTGEEQAGDEAGALMQMEPPDRPLQQREQQHAFGESLDQLAGIARQQTGRAATIERVQMAAAEHDADRRLRDLAPQFAVDEVGDAPEEQADRRHRTGEIADRKKLRPRFSRTKSPPPRRR